MQGFFVVPAKASLGFPSKFGLDPMVLRISAATALLVCYAV
jgi:hypothetical protein